MLLLLVFLMLIASIVVLLIRRSKETFYLAGMTFSLMVYLSGVMIFIAKKGGYSKVIIEFLFINLEFKTRVQYMFIKFDEIGFMITIGRYLFPYFFVLVAMHYSMIPFIRQHAALKRWVAVLPISSFIIYIPSVYKQIISIHPMIQDILVQCSYFWVLAYVAAAVVLLVYEYFSITIKFCKRQFGLVIICFISISGLYILYCGQDPGQVYRFYSYEYIWNKGIGYLQYTLSIEGYYFLMGASIVCGILGFTGLFRYTQGSLESNREEISMERKFDMARVGASMFVHGMKNQLLSERVIYKRIGQMYENNQVDIESIKKYVEQLEGINETLINRMEDLNHSVKSNAIQLLPVTLEQIAEQSIERFHSKYPDAKVQVSLECDMTVLADEKRFCEVIYNLLINAKEAVMDTEREEEITFISHNERLWTVIEIRDNGAGISKHRLKKIFDPFYSSKNSNYNWGMGLYYVRAIVRGHLGDIRVESKEGRGTSFFIMLPKYMAGKSERIDGR